MYNSWRPLIAYQNVHSSKRGVTLHGCLAQLQNVSFIVGPFIVACTRYTTDIGYFQSFTVIINPSFTCIKQTKLTLQLYRVYLPK